MNKIQWLSINGKPMGVEEVREIKRLHKPHGRAGNVPLLIVDEIIECPICADPILVGESVEEGGVIYHASCLRELRELLSCP